ITAIAMGPGIDPVTWPRTISRWGRPTETMRPCDSLSSGCPSCEIQGVGVETSAAAGRAPSGLRRRDRADAHDPGLARRPGGPSAGRDGVDVDSDRSAHPDLDRGGSEGGGAGRLTVEGRDVTSFRAEGARLR